jgi:hypothetical protein
MAYEDDYLDYDQDPELAELEDRIEALEEDYGVPALVLEDGSEWFFDEHDDLVSDQHPGIYYDVDQDQMFRFDETPADAEWDDALVASYARLTRSLGREPTGRELDAIVKDAELSANPDLEDSYLEIVDRDEGDERDRDAVAVEVAQDALDKQKAERAEREAPNFHEAPGPHET